MHPTQTAQQWCTSLNIVLLVDQKFYNVVALYYPVLATIIVINVHLCKLRALALLIVSQPPGAYKQFGPNAEVSLTVE